MRLSALLLQTAGSGLPSGPQAVFGNSQESTLRIPTSYESAVMARRVLDLTPLGTLSTVFPSAQADTTIKPLEQRPSGLSGIPIGLMDYIADCEPDSGNPTILAISIATSFRNVAAGSNISLSLQWTPPYPPKSRIESVSYSTANLPRFSLLGYLERVSEQEVVARNMRECFTQAHPDAKYWLPGNPIHQSEWMRLVVQDVYWIGGFGDRAYIGWIPIEEWRNVTIKEWKDVRLPGEKKGWKEWTVDKMSRQWK